MWPKAVYLILFLIFSISHLIKATDVDNCCRYGFEDGVKLNMLRENKKWSVIRSKNFAYCEPIIPFGKDAFRMCKTIGEEMALNCTTGRDHALLGYDCDVFRDEHPTVYTCCMTCSNGRTFAEEQFDMFNGQIEKYGEELFRNKSLYNKLINQVDIDKQCKMLNLVYLIPELQLSTFRQCCRSWNYNYNQNFYPDHFSVNDTCNRIDVCLARQNHTQFDFDKYSDPKDFVRLKTENVMKIIKLQMDYEQKWFDKHFEEVILNGPTEVTVVPLARSSDEFHEKKSRSVAEEKEFHLNISAYELSLRRVPSEKFKYHYCNKFCKPLDYDESLNPTSPSPKKNSIQCFHNSNQQFCAIPIDCQIGYLPNHNNTLCVELNECDAKLDDCLTDSEKCINHYDGYTCECRPGFRYDAIMRKCANVNECKETKELCPPLSYCIDLEGSYECKCFEGLFKNESGQCLPIPTKSNEKIKVKNQKSDAHKNEIYFSSESDPPESEDATSMAARRDFELKMLEEFRSKNSKLTNVAEKKNDSDVNNEVIPNTMDNALIGRQLTKEESTSNPLIDSNSVGKTTESTIVSTISNLRDNPSNTLPNNFRENSLNNSSDNLSNKTRDNLPDNSSGDKSTDKLSDKLAIEVERISSKPIDNVPTSTRTPETEIKTTQLPPLVQIDPTASSVIGTNGPRGASNELTFSSSNIEQQTPLVDLIDATGNPCPPGYLYSADRLKTCVDINECADAKLNKCSANETCVNLEGSFQCKPKDDCPKGYRDINVNFFPKEHHQESSSRTSTICKYVHSRDFELDEERLSYEKSNSIIQFIIYDTAGLPFRNDSTGYVQVYKDRTIEKADGERQRPRGIVFYLVDKTKKSAQLNLDYTAQFKIRSTTCSNGDMSTKFRMIELNSNVFAIVLLDEVKESCSIDFSLDIQTRFSTQTSNFNRELYNLHLILYQYEQSFTIAANLVS